MSATSALLIDSVCGMVMYIIGTNYIIYLFFSWDIFYGLIESINQM